MADTCASGFGTPAIRKVNGTKHTSKFDPWVGPSVADIAFQDMMERGSDDLRKAICRQHPVIMSNLQERYGRTVVWP